MVSCVFSLDDLDAGMSIVLIDQHLLCILESAIGMREPADRERNRPVSLDAADQRHDCVVGLDQFGQNLFFGCRVHGCLVSLG